MVLCEELSWSTNSDCERYYAPLVQQLREENAVLRRQLKDAIAGQEYASWEGKP